MSGNNDDIKKIFIFSPGRDFVRPYFERFLPEYDYTDDINVADYAIMISSTDVYDAGEGRNYNELSPVDENGQCFRDEREFESLCAAAGLKPLILRCANIVATGMQGRIRHMADRIYRGYYMNIIGNEAVISAVHAVDIPVVARALLHTPGIYNLTDGSEVKLNDLADAIAWRMGQKRIFSIKAKWYRLLFGKRNYTQAVSNLTFSDAKLRTLVDYKPTSVVEYLKTHVYDSESL